MSPDSPAYAGRVGLPGARRLTAARDVAGQHQLQTLRCQVLTDLVDAVSSAAGRTDHTAAATARRRSASSRSLSSELGRHGEHLDGDSELDRAAWASSAAAAIGDRRSGRAGPQLGPRRSVRGLEHAGELGVNGRAFGSYGWDSPPFVKLETARIMPAPGLRRPEPPGLHAPSVSDRRESCS